jgi:hypothetical protein
MSMRTTLSDDNMDLVMELVREKGKNPSDILNYLLNNPDQIISARSKLNDRKKGEKREKS